MNTQVRYLTRTALLLALTLVVQLIGFPQPVTGPLVNLCLFVAVFFVGIGGGSFIGLLTPLVAFSRGILPPPLAPMLPFIALGNIALVVVFGLLKKFNKYIAMIVAAVVKFLILAAGVNFFIKVPGPIAKAMQTPQLINAIIGGILAIIIVQLLRGKVSENIKA